MLARLYEAFTAEEAMLVEVNPLAVLEDRSVKALDGKVTLDGNSLYRHPENAELRNVAAEDPQERMARERDLTYIHFRRDHPRAPATSSWTPSTASSDDRSSSSMRRSIATEMPSRAIAISPSAIPHAISIACSTMPNAKPTGYATP